MSLNTHLDFSLEVQHALANGRPLVALESTIISHGMPYPQNVATALQVEAQVRAHGAVPATIAIVDGRLKTGLSATEIENLGKRGRDAIKVSRRDIPFIVAAGQTGGVGQVCRRLRCGLRLSVALHSRSVLALLPCALV